MLFLQCGRAARLWQGRERARLAVLGRPRPRHRPHLPQRRDRGNLQHRRVQRVEEHRHHQGADQHGGPPAGPSGRGRYGPHHLCDGQCRARPSLRHRLFQVAARTGLGTVPAVRGGHRKDGALVSGPPVKNEIYLFPNSKRFLFSELF